MARMITRTTPRQRAAPSAAWGISPEARQHMIDEAAYYRFVQRGFEPGHDVEDWLAAETQFERHGRRQHPRQPDTVEEVGMAHGSARSPAGDDKLKRVLKAHSGRDIPRVESMEPKDAPPKQ